MLNLPENKQIILFDGVCNLCNKTVQRIIALDKKDVFRFVSLQSVLGQDILYYLGINSQETDSVVLYVPQQAYYIKADAIIEIAKQMGGIYQLLGLFAWLPNGLKNMVYDWVANNRYQWYGKQAACMIPTPELKEKFL